jgi:hypothetical protein
MLRGLISGTECTCDKKIRAGDSHLEWASVVAGELGDARASGKSAADEDLIAAGEETEYSSARTAPDRSDREEKQSIISSDKARSNIQPISSFSPNE